MEPKIFVGEYEVIANGVVLTHNNKDISFDFSGLVFTFTFIKDNSFPEGKLEGEVDKSDPKHLVIKLINFESSFGRGLINPVEVGELEGKQLLLHFNVSTLGNTDTKFFEYSWLTKKKEGVNGQK